MNIDQVTVTSTTTFNRIYVPNYGPNTNGFKEITVNTSASTMTMAGSQTYVLPDIVKLISSDYYDKIYWSNKNEDKLYSTDTVLSTPSTSNFEIVNQFGTLGHRIVNITCNPVFSNCYITFEEKTTGGNTPFDLMTLRIPRLKDYRVLSNQSLYIQRILVLANYSTLNTEVTFVQTEFRRERNVYLAGLKNGMVLLKEYHTTATNYYGSFTKDYGSKGELLSGAYTSDLLALAFQNVGFDSKIIVLDCLYTNSVLTDLSLATENPIAQSKGMPIKMVAVDTSLYFVVGTDEGNILVYSYSSPMLTLTNIERVESGNSIVDMRIIKATTLIGVTFKIS